ncbi:uncharacterized protein V6R79_018504 [Siganus canaliculatus]
MIRINNTQYFHFLQQADALRRSGSLCDAIISVKSQTFKAHRLVLACASRRLAKQLALGDLDTPVHCTLEYFSPHTFQQVLDFTYMQTLDVPVDDLHLLLRAAQLLEMQPLEDQCRRQLDKLLSSTGEVKKEEQEEKDIKMHVDENQDVCPVEEQKAEKRLTLEDELCHSVEPEKTSSSDPVKNPNFVSSPRKKHRQSPASATPYNRESVITRPGSNSSSFSSPWTFPANMWTSVSALRRIAENYTTIVGTHPLQPPSQASVAHPLSLTSSHMLPLFGSHFHSSVMGYSSFHPRYTQNLYVGSTGMESIIKQGLLKRKKPGQRAFSRNAQTGEPSYSGLPKASAEGLRDCQHCSANHLGERESASTPTGVVCEGCPFSERRDIVQHEPQSQRQEHRGDKPYHCQHCPKKFSLKHQLDTHHRVHTGEKPFECRLCGQRSRDYSAMIKHLRTHGGAAPYKCTVCLEFCNSLVAMQRHVKSHAVQDFPPDWTINHTYLYISHI